MKWLVPGLIAVLFAVHGPPFLRTGLNLDAHLFGLFVRDAAAGKVLYRDMVENKPPGMYWAVGAVRATFGDSPEALRAVDLVIVMGGLTLLARFVPVGCRGVAFLLMAASYFAATEWEHTQADVWCLLPVALALRLRLSYPLSPEAGERGPDRLARRFAAGIVEGLLWGAAVWMKPHVLVAAAGAWLASAAWTAGRGRKAFVLDLAAVMLGGTLAGAVGVAAMMHAGTWDPFVHHMLHYAPEYPKADLYAPATPWVFRIGYLVRHAPFSLPYLFLTLAAPVLLRRAVRADADPKRVLLLGLLIGWAAQAWLLQHVFDYVHTVGVCVSIALLVSYLADLPAAGRRFAFGTVAVLAAFGVADQTVTRAANWQRCWGDPTPELRDDLAKFPQVNWKGIAELAAFLRGTRTGEVVVLNDAAVPVFTALGTSPPGRYYFLQNNLIGFRSRRAEIWADVGRHPVRFLVCMPAAVRRSGVGDTAETAPLPPDWFGPRRWADRVRRRAGPYAVVELSAAELPAFLEDCTDYGPD